MWKSFLRWSSGYPNLSFTEFDRIRMHPFFGRDWTGAGRDIKGDTMPGAEELSFHHLAFYQRCPVVCAEAVEGVKISVDIEKKNLPLTNLYNLSFPFGHIVNACDTLIHDAGPSSCSGAVYWL
jgi:hypothetical protein